jgi:hypothetical protein
MHWTEHIHKLCQKPLHASAPSCHPQGALDTKEYTSNTPTYLFKTLNTNIPIHIKLTTINHNAAMLKELKVLKTSHSRCCSCSKPYGPCTQTFASIPYKDLVLVEHMLWSCGVVRYEYTSRTTYQYELVVVIIADTVFQLVPSNSQWKHKEWKLYPYSFIFYKVINNFRPLHTHLNIYIYINIKQAIKSHTGVL